MFVLRKRKTFVRNLMAICLLFITINSVFITLKNIETGVNAITAHGATVNVKRQFVNGVEIPIYYSSSAYGTVRFYITNSANEVFTGFCRNPNLRGPDRIVTDQGVVPPADPPAAPAGSNVVALQLQSSSGNNAVAKFLIYVGTVDSAAARTALSTLMKNDALGKNVTDPDAQFGFIHAALGYLNEGTVDYKELTNQTEKDFVISIVDKARAMISNQANNAAWQEAKHYTLYGLDTTRFPKTPAGEDYQDVVWIENVSLNTYARDNVDNDKTIEATSTAKIKDTIDYCLPKNMTYTITGTIMDKATGRPLSINGANVTASTTINTNTDSQVISIVCGTTNVIFNLDASTLVGKRLVVFERAYRQNESTPVVEHTDINDEEQSILVEAPQPANSLNTTAVDNTDSDKYIEATSTAKIKDTIDYCLGENATYTIEGVVMDKESGEPLKIDNKSIEESITIEVGDSSTSTVTPPNISTTCGSATMIFSLDASDIAGKKLVVFESIYEENASLPVVEHKDINDDDQSVNVISLSTFATNGKDGTKKLITSETSEIDDRVDYCLAEGETFTIKGVLMDKKTKKEILVDGKKVEKSVTITPEEGESCGSVKMTYKLNTLGFGGKEIVIYDEVYLGEELILSHTNPNNADETVSIEKPETPNTGVFTKYNDETDQGSMIFFIASIPIIAISSYIVNRIKSHKRVSNFR